MSATKLVAVVAGLLIALGAPQSVADDAPGRIEGEVVRVMQQTRNEGEFDALMVRTRQGEEMRLLLGEAGSSAGRVQEGDRVRARLSDGGPTEEGYQVRSMKVRRTGQNLQYRNAEGDMLQTRTRGRDGSGAAAQNRTRDRTRIHEPGTGNGPSGGNGGQRGRNGRGGSGR